MAGHQSRLREACPGGLLPAVDSQRAEDERVEQVRPTSAAQPPPGLRTVPAAAASATTSAGIPSRMTVQRRTLKRQMSTRESSRRTAPGPSARRVTTNAEPSKATKTSRRKRRGLKTHDQRDPEDRPSISNASSRKAVTGRRCAKLSGAPFVVRCSRLDWGGTGHDDSSRAVNGLGKAWRSTVGLCQGTARNGGRRSSAASPSARCPHELNRQYDQIW